MVIANTPLFVILRRFHLLPEKLGLQNNNKKYKNRILMRRRFSPEYKLQILTQVAACTEPGQIGALLKQERLYFSNLSVWRRQRDQGLLSIMAPKKRGRKATHSPPLSQRIEFLEKENRTLQEKLKQAERVITAQKKRLRTAQARCDVLSSPKATVMTATLMLSNDVGRKAACEALQVSRASFYRHLGHLQNPQTNPTGEGIHNK